MGETKTLITADQFLHMSFPDEHVELSDGELIRMAPAGFEHGYVAGTIFGFLHQFVTSNKLGAVVTAEAGYKLADHTVRAPDIGFVSRKRLETVGRPVGFWPGAPDLAVEVISPDEPASDLQKKVREYFRAGTRIVWAVYPRLQQVHVYRGPKEIRVLEANEVLSGEDVLPGFSIRVEEFFK